MLTMHLQQRPRLDHADVPSGQRDQLSDLHMQRWVLRGWQDMLAVQDLLAQRRHDWRMQLWKCDRRRGVLVQRWLLWQRRDVLTMQDMPCGQRSSCIPLCCWKHSRHSDVRVQCWLLRQRRDVLAVHVQQRLRLDHADVPSGQRDQLSYLHMQRGVLRGWQNMFTMQDLLAQRRNDGHMQRWECVGWRGVLMQRGLLWQRSDLLAMHMWERLRLDHADVPSEQRNQLSDLRVQRGILRGRHDMLAVQDLLAQRRNDWRMQCWECDRRRSMLVQRGLLRQRRDVLAVQDMPCSQRSCNITLCGRKHCRHSDVQV